jgi:hypothetical protein
VSSAHLASPSTNSANAASILASVDFFPVPNSTIASTHFDHLHFGAHDVRACFRLFESCARRVHDEPDSESFGTR